MKKLHSLLALTALLGLSLFAAGCGKDAAKAPEAKKPKVEATVKAETTKAADEAKAKAEAKAEAAKKAAPVAKPVSADERKEKLAAAYADVYCAQITGKAEDVLAAYKRHGFENLDDWTRAWRAASKDVDWVKQVMSDAKKACP
jgi:hypothetical protein